MTAFALPAAGLIGTTPSGLSEDKKIILQRSMQAYKPYVRQLVEETEREIEALRDLPADWDGEGAEPIAPQAILSAKRLTLHIAEISEVLGLRRLPSAVTPNPDGGIDLTWIVGDRKIIVIIHPKRDEVALVFKRGSALPQRTILPIKNAAIRALSALNAL